MSSEQDTITEYAYASPEPKHFEAVPGIIDYLTYIEQETLKDGTQVWVRKRLKPIYKDVYRVIKKLAGEEVCIRTEDYIATVCGCSPMTVADAKEALSMPFEQLDGKPLISITEKRVMTTKEDEKGQIKKINKRPVHICSVEPVWQYNNPFMKKIFKLKASDPKRLPTKMKEYLTTKEAELAIEKMSQQGIYDTVHKSGADPKNGVSPEADPKNGVSPQGSKEGRPHIWGGQQTPLTNPFVKGTNPTAKHAVQMSLINQNFVEENFTSQATAVKWLMEIGFKQKVVNEILHRYNLHELTATILYIQQELKKKQLQSSLTGYIMKALEGQWWKPKLAEY